jgi:hypothetical protein
MEAHLKVGSETTWVPRPLVGSVCVALRSFMVIQNPASPCHFMCHRRQHVEDRRARHGGYTWYKCNEFIIPSWNRDVSLSFLDIDRFLDSQDPNSLIRLVTNEIPSLRTSMSSGAIRTDAGALWLPLMHLWHEAHVIKSESIFNS